MGGELSRLLSEKERYPLVSNPNVVYIRIQEGIAAAARKKREEARSSASSEKGLRAEA